MIILRNRITFALLAIVLITGCMGSSGGSSSSDTEKRPSLNEGNIINTSNEEKKFEQEEFSDGVIQKDVEVVVKSDKGEETSKTVVSAGTQFKDESGKTVEEAPSFVIVQKESKEEEVKDGVNTTRDVVQSEFIFKDKNGNKVVPTEPIKISIKAPTGAKPGDEVRVNVPNGVSNASIQQKLNVIPRVTYTIIIVIVEPDSFLKFIIMPIAFGDGIVTITIEKKTTKTLTGGTGGN